MSGTILVADGGSPMRAGRSDAAHLPPDQPIRWVMRRKAEVLAAIRCGRLTVGDACDRYALSMDELISWEIAMKRFGQRGLCVTRRMGQAPAMVAPIASRFSIPHRDAPHHTPGTSRQLRAR